MGNKVQITVTEEQARYIMQALDFTARFNMGQMSSSYLPYQTSQLLEDKDKDSWLYRRDLWDKQAEVMKSILHPKLSPNGHYTFSFNDLTNNCCAMEKAIGVLLYDDSEGTYSSYIDIYDVPKPDVKYVTPNTK